MRFHNPEAFYLLILLIPVIVIYILREKTSKSALRFSDISTAKSIKPSFAIYARHILIFLKVAGLALLIVALARPQKGSSYEEITSEGVDIMLVMDNSGSMAALDFKPKNRLEVARERMIEFIDKRTSDRMGLVVFAGRAQTRVPLTLDYDLLRQFVNEIQLAEPEMDGTAIGTAIATAANRLRTSPSESRVMILLTDGANNRGEISPLAAARAAAALGIRIHVIGVGKQPPAKVPFPVRVQNPFTGRISTELRMIESDLDEETARQIANITGGRYFLATSSEEFQRIYEEIDAMEKSSIQSRVFMDWNEYFHAFLIWGFVLLTIEFILARTRFRRIP